MDNWEENYEEVYDNDVSDIAAYRSAVYGNESLKLREIKQQKYEELIIDNRETDMKDQNEHDFENNKNAKNITKSHLIDTIRIVTDSTETYTDLNAMYRGERGWTSNKLTQ
eukprot:432360_1